MACTAIVLILLQTLVVCQCSENEDEVMKAFNAFFYGASSYSGEAGKSQYKVPDEWIESSNATCKHYYHGRCLPWNDPDCERFDGVPPCLHDSMTMHRCCVDWKIRTCEEKYSGVCVPSDDRTCTQTGGFEEPWLCPEEPNTKCCTKRLDVASEREMACGETAVEGQSGADVQPGNWPWLAFVFLMQSFSYCSAILVHPQWILTAGKCPTAEERQQPFYSSIGVGVIKSHERVGSEQSSKIARFYVRPDNTKPDPYAQEGLTVALVKGKTPFVKNKYINTVCLPKSGDDLTGTDCWFVGYGGSAGKRPQVDIAHHVSGSVTACEGGLCFTGKGKLCGYDHGGAVVCKKDGKFVLSGIVGELDDTCQDATSVRLESASDFIDWLNATVEKYT